MNTKFLILLGVSGVGKSTLINELIQIDSRFVYISPYTNRPLRLNEKDKIFKTDFEIDFLVSTQEALIVNEIYGYKYVTPKEKIHQAFASNNYPLLDFPIQKLQNLKNEYGDKIYSVYLMPPSINELKSRLNDGRDKNGERYEAALKEIREVTDDRIRGYNYLAINDCVTKVAKTIYNNFLNY